MLEVRRDGDIAVLELCREARRNALDLELCRLLHAAVDELVDIAPADGGVRAIVITGRGSAFCSGADLTGVYGDEFLEALYGMLHRLSTVPVPTIAAVNGAAIGAGTQLAIACDLRVADDSARFGVPTVRNGMAVDAWTIRTLAALAGTGPARRLMLAGDLLDRDEALAHGLVDRAGTLNDALAWAHEIATLAPMTIAYSKAVLQSDLHGTFNADATAAAFREVWASDDVREAQQARVEKRTPIFRGR